MNQHHLSQVSQAERIISRFGSPAKMAKHLGVRRSTVQRWKDSGLIRKEHWRRILFIARRDGVPVEPYDFVEDFVAHLHAILSEHDANGATLDHLSAECKERLVQVE